MLEKYIEENAHKTPDGLASLNDLVGSYRVWMIQRGHRPPERRHVEAQLKELGYEIGQFYTKREMIVGLSFGSMPKYGVENGKIKKVRK